MKQKLTLLVSLLLIATFALAACSSPAAPTAAPVAPQEPQATAPVVAPPAAPEGKLVIWADDTRAPILQKLAPQVLETYNLELSIRLFSGWF